ncbi:MAG: glycosyltransferase family 2 protein [Candidatus Eremiobacteraeota bacterium]|nr:glycosyltransferase family 2 protein [Candidatus Eremiobacteraeota bacterium]
MAPDPKVAIAIPYGGGAIEYLRSACESLTRQNHAAWTAVVIDDSLNPAEEVAELVRSWAQPRISYKRHQAPHGIGNAWNACIEAADTELFCLLHADDELEPDYLRTMVDLAQAYPEASLYFCGATIIDEDGLERFSLPDRVKDVIRTREEPIILNGSSAVERLIVGNFIMCPTAMYRLSRVAGLRFSDRHRFVLDLRFNLGILFEGGLIVGTQRKAYRYRRHAAQATAQLSSTGDRFEEELELFREIRELASARGWDRVASAARTRAIFRIHAALARKWKYVFA